MFLRPIMPELPGFGDHIPAFPFLSYCRDHTFISVFLLFPAADDEESVLKFAADQRWRRRFHQYERAAKARSQRPVTAAASAGLLHEPGGCCRGSCPLGAPPRSFAQRTGGQCSPADKQGRKSGAHQGECEALWTLTDVPSWLWVE